MVNYKLFILCPLLTILWSCEKHDPILSGIRTPIFNNEQVQLIKDRVSIGDPIKPEPCEYTINSDNTIWKDGSRIFAGLPTSSDFKVDKKVICHDDFIYAGLSTGELIKVDAKTRKPEWIANIFSDKIVTGGTPFLDIIATPVYNNGFIYAGGLGDAFCKVRDSDGKKVWCLPISVQNILITTKNFNVLKTADEQTIAVSNDGKAYEWSE